MRHSAAHPNTWTGQWRRRARITDDPAGDLIADIRSSATSRPYLRARGACAEAMASRLGFATGAGWTGTRFCWMTT